MTPRSIRTLAAVSTAVLAVLALAFHLSSTQASHDPGAMAAMAIDMDPGASPANTATSLGTREFCARINENGALDADEDAVDAVQFDVTADGIPPETAMMAFSYRLVYGEANLTVQSHDANFLLTSAPGSSLLDASEPLPDTDGAWTGSAIDIETNATESGSGVLGRVTLSADAGAAAGVYKLDLTNNAHIDDWNVSHEPELTLDGWVAVNTTCLTEEPSPDPALTASPAPPPPAIVRGTVRDQDGNAVAGATVHGVEAAADGTYEITLTAASYRLYASAPGYESEYWTSTGGAPDWDQAEEVTVLPGQVVEGIDFSLNKLPVLSGTVSDAAGNAIDGATVVASGSGWCCDVVYTDQAGHYELILRVLGTYTLNVWVNGYVPEYWTSTGGTPDEALAEPVTATFYGQVLTGYDFSLTRKGRLRGTVQDNRGNPLEDASIELFHEDGRWCECSVGHSDATGAYEVIGIDPGTYRVHVVKWGYVAEYWTSTGGTRDWSLAELVTFSGDEIREGVDSQLARFGIIRGRVTDSQGEPIAGVEVTAQGDCCWGSFSTTDDQGYYEITNLGPDQYRVQAWSDQYVRGYWTSAGTVSDLASAEPIAVSLDQTVEGVDLTLQRLARISGRVLNSGGEPLPNILIWFGAPGGPDYLAVRTGGDGTYERYVDAGTYRIHTQSDVYPSVYWTSTGGIADPSLAESVTVALEEDRTGIDFVLLRFGSISGRVTDSGGAPVANAQIYASQPACCSWASNTDESGFFRIDGLSTGEYEVSLYRRPWEHYYWNRFGGSSDPALGEPVTASLDADTSGINFVLPELAELSGTVTDSSGNPLPNAYVHIRGVGESWYYADVQAGPDGSYRFTELPKGTFVLSANAYQYQHEWWTADGGTTEAYSAQQLTIEFGSTTSGVDFQLSKLGEVTGKVLDKQGDPIPGAVIAVDTNACCYGSYWYGPTEADGSFKVVGLAPGAYFVSVRGDGIETTYWTSGGGSADRSLAETVQVAYDQVTGGVNFSVNRLGKISGRITNSAGDAVGSAGVAIRRADGSPCYSCQDDVANYDGVFEVYAPPGDYVVSASAWPYVSEYWTSDGGTSEPLNAYVFTLDYGSDVSGIDFELARKSLIKGSVRDDHGEPIVQVSVYAESPQESDSEWVWGSEYTLGYLSPGDYLIWVNYRGRPAYWTPAGITFAKNEAALLHVDTEQVIAGIDFTLPRMGSITGRVTDRDGQPLIWKPVSARNVDGSINASTYTDDNGFYEVKVHGTGYILWADDDYYYGRTYDRQYWTSAGGTSDSAQAGVVQGEYDAVVTGIDFALPERGGVAGVVTDSSGNPLSGAYVSAEPFGCCGWGSAYTDADGSFRIDHLPSGSYRLGARKDGYLSQYWTAAGGTDSWSAAQPIVVHSEQTMPANFRLLRPGRVSGHVTNTAGEPLSGVYVLLSGADCCPYDITDADGSYEVTVQRPGDYMLNTWSKSGTYVTEYWSSRGGTGNRQGAELLPIPLEANVKGIDFVLKRPGSLTGTVRDNAGNPIPYASLTYSGPSCGSTCSWWVDSQGQFTISNLYPGDYTLKAEHPDYQAEFWTDDGGSVEEGDPVTVPEGGTASGIDFSLNKLGSISGTVTGPDGTPVAGASIVYDSQYCEDCNGPTTNAEGKFKIDRIPPGGYVIGVTAPGMTAEYWTPASGTSDEDRAQEIALGDGQDVTGVNFSLLPEACALADITGDTRVNVLDIVAVARAMGSRPGRHNWNPDADINDDGRVNVHDLAIVIRSFHSRECR